MNYMVRVRAKRRLHLRRPVVLVDRRRKVNPPKRKRQQKKSQLNNKTNKICSIWPPALRGAFLCNQRNEVFSLSGYRRAGHLSYYGVTFYQFAACYIIMIKKLNQKWITPPTGPCSNSEMR